MSILGIETATSVCSVGLANGESVREVWEEAGRRHSVLLVDLVDRLLDEAEVKREQLSGVAVSSGPGSFTGLRIGMGLAKGICMAADLPLLTVSTLEALAVHSASEATSVCACLDARHDQLYSGEYARAGAGWDVRLEDAGRSVEDLVKSLRPDTAVVGFGIDTYASRLISEGFKVDASVRPSGAAVARVGARLLEAGEATALESAEPNYCRKSQAERKQDGEDV